MDEHAREYLFLELSMGLHDEGHVDAYFGPEEIRASAIGAQLPLDEVEARADRLRHALLALRGPGTNREERMRLDGLVGRLVALQTRIELARGNALDFDEESRRLFGAAAPDRDADYYRAVLDEIDALLGGDGPLSDRVTAYRDRFMIPDDRLAAVFDAAVDECRRRTLLYIRLPDNESFTIEYVTDKPWGGYNWYQGNAESLIQINTDLPIPVSRAVVLGCHEAYPGHHTYNALLEQHLVDEKGWLEFTLYPLFSPQSFIAEGTGNYGVDLAFPGDERVRFETEVLFPLAGLDASEAERYYALTALLGQLDYAQNEAARDYLNGDIGRDAAIDWLVTYALMPRDLAHKRVDFFDTYRSYVINYNLGADIVRAYIEEGDPDPDERWARFERLLSSPMTVNDLR